MKKDPSQKGAMNRREFLGSANCAAIGSVPLFNTLLNLKMIGNVAGQSTSGSDGYKAMVCLFLNAGNDSYNMLVPTSPDEMTNYQAVRSNLALGIAGNPSPLPLDRVDSPKTPDNNTRTFGIHPSMPGLQSIFNDGDLAFVANVGTLVEPTTIQQYDARSVALPIGLFSHAAQLEQWQTSLPSSRSTATGWIGRVTDVVSSLPSTLNGSVSMNISLGGNNIAQTGNETFVYSISEDGSTGLRGTEFDLNGFILTDVERLRATASLMEEEYRNLYMKSFGQSNQQATEAHANFSIAFDAVEPGTGFPTSSLGRDLQGIARAIGARNELGTNRQTYFAQRRGFDNHNNLLTDHAPLLADVDASVTAFWNEMGRMGLQDQVVLFTISDFARTLRSNGVGSDHGWGGNHFVLGGGVDGKKIYGSYPDVDEFSISRGLDIGSNGRLLPTLSTDEYFAELALWFGVPAADLEEVFPNLANFWDGTGSPIGYFNP